MDSPSPRDTNLRRPHPLATALIERLRERPHARILELGTGSGRNTAALEAAGFAVHSVPDAHVQTFSSEPGFDAAITTHALQHGTPAIAARLVDVIATLLNAGGPLYATFGSTNDARYGKGTHIDADTFAPELGDEEGVAHVYFTEDRLRELLDPYFIIESLEEHSVDEIVGRWAHAQQPQGSVHWFVQARRRDER